MDVPTAERGSYAQFGEDRILEQIFGSTPHGYCAEVGAHDGRTGSATYAFERKGWDCILVEPIPACVEEIRRHRNCIVAECAASSRDGEATLFIARGVEGMSTLDASPGHRRLIDIAGGEIEEVTVRTRRLDDLLLEARFPELQFITIDVEGHEMEVLKGFSLDRYRPRVVIVENNSLHPENWPRRRSEVTAHMAAHEYRHFRRTGVNEWYAHQSDRALVQPDQLRRFAWAKEAQLWRHCRRRMAHEIAMTAGRYLPASTKHALRKLARSEPLTPDERERDR